MANGNTNTPKGVGDELKDAFRLPTAAEFADAYLGISEGSAKINKAFGQTRQRIVEIQTAIADTSPGIARLGGNVNDVTNTISELAQASRRNVIANTEDVDKMFAAQKILGGSVKGIADSFMNVGVGISQIPKELEKAITYIQSIGGNAEEVMRDVQSNMEQMNRYQFEGGVQGLTKMAAQASMLRTDMGTTLRFAEDLYQPDKAIEVASAFQRLGVSAGALADPFQLMNMSINDPTGLQNSLANVAKQFTEFDEKTKTFKINPQGVITLKEMGQQAGIDSKELMKMGLAAAEADKRLSEIGSAGLNIKDDDKQYLANIASMGKSGKYEVELKDGTKKELQNLNQEEFDKLIEQQKNGPKDLEGIARSQMTATDIIKGDVNAIRTAVTGGLVTQQGFLKGMEGARNVATGLTGNASKELGNTGAVRETVGQTIGDLTKAVNEFINNKDKKPTDVLSDYLKTLGQQGVEINKSLQEKVTKILEKSRGELKDDNAVERTTTKIYDALLGGAKANNVNGNQPISSLIEGTNASSAVKNVVSNNNSGFYGGSATSKKVNVDGGFKIDINFNGGAENLTSAQKEEITKMLIEKMNSTDMKQYMIEVNAPNNPTKAPTGKTVTR
jgi:hypothetical protein